MRPNGEVVLIDFGAARSTVGRLTRDMTSIVSEGYSPPEQYGSAGRAQGPWSDLYALGATLYQLATGVMPVSSQDRQMALELPEPDPLVLAAELARGRYSPEFLGWIDGLLRLSFRQRPQSASAALASLLALGGRPAPAPAPSPARTKLVRPEERFPKAVVAAPGEAVDDFSPAVADSLSGSGEVPASGSPPGDRTGAAVTSTRRGVGLALATCGVLLVSGLAVYRHVNTLAESPSAGSSLASAEREIPGPSPASPAPSPAAPAKTSDGLVLVPVGGALPGEGVAFRHALRGGGEGPEMVVLPSGRFRMGSEEGESDEKPVREVAIQSFALGVTELTFKDWDLCVERGGCGGYRPEDEGWVRVDRPVINVSWSDAQAYVEWLRGETGGKYRLPSESEWEYGARAGTQTAYWWGNEIGRNRANCDGCGSQWDDRQTSPVKSFASNGLGLYDTSGNVWEWVQDCYVNSYAGAPVNESALERSNCKRVLRGASWDDGPVGLRSADRGRNTRAFRSSLIGFRLALDR